MLQITAIVCICATLRLFASGFTSKSIGSISHHRRPPSPHPSAVSYLDLSLYKRNKASVDIDNTVAEPDAAVEATAEEAPQTANNGDIKITTSSVLPPVPSSALIDVYYAEQAINALGTLGEIIEAYHAGMVFEILNYEELLASGEIADKDLVPREFTIEWYAEKFPFGAFLPRIITEEEHTIKEDGVIPSSVSKLGLQWDNDSWAFYNPAYKPDRWTKGRTLIGTVAGTAIAKYAEWIVDYCKNNPGYAAFEVWDRPYLQSGVTRRWQASNTCSTFTQASMEKLYELGKEQKVDKQIEGVALAKDVISNTQLILRSYAPLISKSNPTLVDIEDPKQGQKVIDFYIELNKAANDGEKLTTSGFIRLLANKLETFYVYDTPSDSYYRVDLDPPYFAVASMYQPVSVPWQRLDLNGDGELEDPAAFASHLDHNEANFVEELGLAARGAVDLAKRRLPSVLKTKLRGKISNELTAGIASIVIAIGLGGSFAVPTGFIPNNSFLSGIAVGVIGAKLLL